MGPKSITTYVPVLPDVGIVAGDDLARGDGVAGDELPGEVDGELARHVDGGRLAHAVRDVPRAAHHALLRAESVNGVIHLLTQARGAPNCVEN